MLSLANESSDRFVVKLSGEVFASGNRSVDSIALDTIGKELVLAWRECPEIAVVVGGGNFYRGRSAMTDVVDRVQADYVGMLATVMNGILLQQWMQSKGFPSKLLSAFPVGAICDSYNVAKAKDLLSAGTLLILAGGTGSPFFTTDTTACLRALEVGATLLIKATRVDGIFDSDPEKDPTAKKFDSLDFEAAISQRLEVMDSTAFSLCRDNCLDIRVLNIWTAGNLCRAVCGDDVGTLVTGGDVSHD